MHVWGVMQTYPSTFMETTLLHANEAAPGNGITRLLVCVNNEVLMGAWVAEHEQNANLCPLHP